MKLRVVVVLLEYGTKIPHSLDDAAKPVKLHLRDRHALPAYAAVIHGFAAELAKTGGLTRLEIGTTKASSLFLPIAFGLLSTAALGISLKTLHNKLNLYRERGILHDDE